MPARGVISPVHFEALSEELPLPCGVVRRLQLLERMHKACAGRPPEPGPQLLWFSDEESLRRYLLQGSILMGRAEDCHLILPPPVRHDRQAAIFTLGYSYLLQDLSPDRSSLVNDHPIPDRGHHLHEGDILNLNGLELVWQLVREPRRSSGARPPPHTFSSPLPRTAP